MVKKTKSSRQNIDSRKVIINFIKAVLGGIISFAILLCIVSIVITKLDFGDNILWIFVVAVSALSSTISSIICCAGIKKKSLFNGMVSVIILLIVEFLILLGFNNADLTYKIYLMIPAMLIFGFLGCVIGSNIRK